MVSEFIVRRGYTVPIPLTWHSTRKSDGTEKFAMTGSVDGFSVLPKTQFLGPICTWTPLGFCMLGFHSPYGSCRGEAIV